MINVDSVTKVYGSGPGKVTALDDVSLKVDSGEISGIIGRSGAGKTTLLRCLNLLEQPTSGFISLDGKDLTSLGRDELRSVRRQIGVIFQHFNLLHARTVERNVAFPLEVAGVSRQARQRRVAELLDVVGLKERANAYPSQLSGGQKQRVGIARALAAEPKVLLCDEATSALDSETTEQILDLIKEVNRRLGVTVVLITHELEVVRRICDSAALIDGGRIIESGNLIDLIGDPHSTLGDQILPTGGQVTGFGDDSTLLTFVTTNATDPILSGVTRDLGLDVSIIGGGIERVDGNQVGRLRVGLADPSGGPVDWRRATAYLESKGVKVRRLGDVKEEVSVA